MKKLLLLTALALPLTLTAGGEYYAVTDSATGKTLRSGGDISPAKMLSPCSTFKIPLALMGYDSGVLIDESNPVFPYRPEYSTPFESWKNDQTPASWMKNSCVWCSQVMTQKMGMDKIKKYLKDFNYGNQDMSGDPGKDNGLTRAWLGSSLKISPAEQTAFIRKLVRGELPVSKESMDKTKKLAQLGTMGDGWSFYGKTGSYDLKTGWFTGWVEKGVTAYIIVMCLEDAVPMDGIMPAGGPVAKEKCRKIILESGLLK